MVHIYKPSRKVSHLDEEKNILQELYLEFVNRGRTHIRLGGEVWENLREQGQAAGPQLPQSITPSPVFSANLSTSVRGILTGLGCDVLVVCVYEIVCGFRNA